MAESNITPIRSADGTQAPPARPTNLDRTQSDVLAQITMKVSGVRGTLDLVIARRERHDELYEHSLTDVMDALIDDLDEACEMIEKRLDHLAPLPKRSRKK